MAFDLRLTTAGRAALADGANVGANAVRITHVAIGDGSGPGGSDDDALAALRSERAREAAVGSAPVERRIAFRADFMPAAAYDVAEVGVFGNVPGQPAKLLAYWSDGGTAIGRTADGTTFVIAANLEFVAAAADVNITVSPNISLGGSALPATDARRGVVELATSDEAKTGTDTERAVTPKALRDAASATAASLLPGGAPAEGAKYRFTGKPMGKLELEEDSGDAATTQAIGAVQGDIATITAALQPLPGQVDALTTEVGAVKGRVDTLEGKTRDATTSRKGIVELATSDEGRAGADEERAMTAKATRDAASATVASLLGAVPEAGKRYALEGRAGGALALVLSSVLLLSTTVTVTTRTRITYEYDPEQDDDVEVYDRFYASLDFDAPASLSVPSAGIWLSCAWLSGDSSGGLDISIAGSEAHPDSGIGSGFYPFTEYPVSRGSARRAIAAIRALAAGDLVRPRVEFRGGTLIPDPVPADRPGNEIWGQELHTEHAAGLLLAEVGI